MRTDHLSTGLSAAGPLTPVGRVRRSRSRSLLGAVPLGLEVCGATLYVAMLVAAVAGVPDATLRAVYSWLWFGCGVVTIAAIAVGVRRHRPRRVAPWALTAALIGVWSLAPLSRLAPGRHEDVTAFSVVFTLCLVLLVAVGLVLFRVGGRPLDRLGKLDAWVVAAGYLGLLLVTQIVPAFRSDGPASVVALSGVIAPLGFAVSLATITRLLFVGAARNRSFRRLFTGYAAIVVPSALFGLLTTTAPEAPVIFSVGPLVLSVAAAALDPTMSGVTEPHAYPATVELSRWRSLTMALAAAAPAIGVAVAPSVPSWAVVAAAVLTLVAVGLLVLHTRVATGMWVRATADLRAMTKVDALTGAANWRGAREHIARAAGPYGLLFCDLDDFGSVNATHSHETGDAVLQVIARRIRAALPSGALVARTGGDQFLVVAPDPGSEHHLFRIAEHIAAAVSLPVELPGARPLVQQVSIGISASGPQRWHHPALLTDLHHEADLALQEARRVGGPRAVAFSASLATQETRTAAVRGALASLHGLHLHFQGIIDLGTKQVVGAEALARLHIDGLGDVSPAEFIPVAESTGLITDLGSEVLRRALAEVLRHRDRLPADFYVSVNVSAQQLTDGAVRVFRAALAGDGSLLHQLRLEITESELAGEDARRCMRSLVDAGFRLVVDDFGTEYAGLQYLTALPLTALKLDQSFVRQSTRSAADRAVVKHVMALAEDLGITVIAEGVETVEQEHLLTSLRCRHAQGFLYDRPAPGLQRFTMQACPRP